MTSDEASSKINVVQIMFFSIHICYLPDIVADCIEERFCNVFGLEGLAFVALEPDFAEGGSDGRGLQPDFGIVGPV